MDDQLAYNPIAEGKFLRWNDTNRKPFASILYKFLLVVLCAAVRKAAVLQMKWLRARYRLATIVKKCFAIDESISLSKAYVMYAIIAATDEKQS